MLTEPPLTCRFQSAPNLGIQIYKNYFNKQNPKPAVNKEHNNSPQRHLVCE